MENQLLLSISTVILSMMCITVCAVNNRTSYQVPDEQRLYRDLMWDYENSVRPVLNANHTVIVHFKLTLNQITDLDERSQVLTTNVFIDQTWTDENLEWDPKDYNNIKTLRLSDRHVWLPDTFLFNNANDGSTGFMKGMYVLIYHNGTVLWPVPVKLKSSCKVDIRYFPFDDQFCEWRFGSWIYSGKRIEFFLGKVDLDDFIDNSEWELLKIDFQKRITNHSFVDEDHSSLHFTLHIRRRQLYYIFNIIAPCVMLSILTLLTFWLPTTSGEKISLGLSVFLAFSMFELLIAEEVPATSESVPLIGIYLTTVMTMTSVSVIMAVMVINLYNRGSQAVHAPKWMKVVVLEGLSRVLCLKHDIQKITDNIKLDKDEEAKYACVAHPPIVSRRSRFRRPSLSTPPPTSKNEDNHNSQEKDSIMLNTSSSKEDTIWGRIEGIRRKSTDLITNISPFNNNSSNKNTSNNNTTDLNFKGNNKSHLVRANGIRRNIPPVVVPTITVTSAEDAKDDRRYKAGKETCKYTRLSCRDDTDADEVGRACAEDSGDDSGENVWVKRDSVIRRANEQVLKRRRSKEGEESFKDIINEEISSSKANPKFPFQQLTSKGKHKLAGWSATIKKRENSKSSNLLKGVNPKLQSKVNPEEDRKNSDQTHNCNTTTTNIPIIKVTPSTDTNMSTVQSPDISTLTPVKRKAIPLKVADVLGTDDTPCPKKTALLQRRQIVVEWQTIATVVDRLLFWLFLMGTVAAYFVVLFIIPHTKPGFKDDKVNSVNFLHRTRSGEIVLETSSTGNII